MKGSKPENSLVGNSTDIPYFKPTMHLGNVESILNSILGRVLTISEAVVEPSKLKATKDLLKDAVWKDYAEISRWHFENADPESKECSTFPIFNRGALD